MIQKWIQFLKPKLSKYWFRLLFTFLTIGFLIWVFLPQILKALGVEIVESFGMSSDVFGIAAGSAATLSGAIAGILITGNFLITQYATSRISDYRGILQREKNYFDTLVEDSKLVTMGVPKNLIRNLQKVRAFCHSVVYEFAEEIDWQEMRGTSGKILRALDNFIKKGERRLASLKKGLSKSSVNNKSQDGRIAELELELQNVQELLKTCDDLVTHLSITLPHLPMMKTSFMLFDVSHQMGKLASAFAIVLAYTLVFLIMSGLTHEGQLIYSDAFRLKMAVGILLGLVPSIILVFSTLHINWEIVKVLVQGRIGD